MTPAMAAGVDSRLWEIGDIVKVVEEWEAPQEESRYKRNSKMLRPLVLATAGWWLALPPLAATALPPNSAGPHTLLKTYLASGNPGTALVSGDNIVSKNKVNCPRNATTCTLALIVTDWTCKVDANVFTIVVTVDGTYVGPDQDVYGTYPGCTGATWANNYVVGPGAHTVTLITRWTGNPEPTQGPWAINYAVTTP